MFKTIDNLIVELSKEPFNPVISFKIAVEYEKIGQTASAVSFYLRTAEYGYATHPEHVYASLLKSAQCFSSQKHRDSTVHNLFLKAIAYLPTRPEAWFLLARYYEQAKKWQESYTFSETGLLYSKIKLTPLPIWVDYPGEYALSFEKAVTGWWVGRKDESEAIFRELLKQDIDHGYRIAIIKNLGLFDHKDDVDPLEPVVTNYRKFFGAVASIIMDIGTRDGDDAYYLYKQLNSSRVIAVDASRQAIALTQAKYPWMSVVYAAVTHEDGETEFHLVTGDNKEALGTSSIFDKTRSIDPSPEYYADRLSKVVVPAVRMDTLLSNLELNVTIDIVKVDTEGYSWQVLQGFGDRLKDVKMLHLETERTAVHDDHKTTEYVTEFMESQGFVLVDTSFEWGWNIQDQLWINPRLVTRNKEFFL